MIVNLVGQKKMVLSVKRILQYFVLSPSYQKYMKRKNKLKIKILCSVYKGEKFKQKTEKKTVVGNTLK